jgi:hypothetical protein
VRWIALIVAGLAVLIAGIATVGAMLPRTHKASRTLRVKRPPADVWPVVMQVTQASDVPVDVLDSQPPHRLVTRVTEKEKNFGGTWTIDLTPVGDGSTITIAEEGWVANPIFRFISRVVIGHHATMDGVLKQVAKTLSEEAVLTGE